MAIQTRSRTYVGKDQRWIGKTEALKDADTVTLDRSGFDLVTAFPNGVIPSGICLGKITATGLYVKYDNAATNGAEVAAGFLVDDIEMAKDGNANDDELGALMWNGEVVEAYLPTGHGLDAAGKTDLAAKFRFV